MLFKPSLIVGFAAFAVVPPAVGFAAQPPSRIAPISNVRNARTAMRPSTEGQYPSTLKAGVAEFLARAVLHDKAGFQFLDGPGRREAAGGHSVVFYAVRKCSQWGHYFRV